MPNFIKNSKVRFILICAILYFGFFGRKDTPDSMGNRLSKENVSKAIGDVRSQATYISKTLDENKELIAQKREESMKENQELADENPE